MPKLSIHDVYNNISIRVYENISFFVSLKRMISDMKTGVFIAVSLFFGLY